MHHINNMIGGVHVDSELSLVKRYVRIGNHRSETFGTAVVAAASVVASAIASVITHLPQWPV